MDIALDILPPSACPFGIVNPVAAVTVDQLIVAVNNALHGCTGHPTITNEPHLGVQVPGPFSLGQPNADPNTLTVFLKSPCRRSSSFS